MIVRNARPGDALRLTALLQQLGYVVSGAHVERSIAAMDGDYRIVVADSGEAGVVGMLEARVPPAAITSQACNAYVSAVVVDAAHRSRGAGEAMLLAIERWARERGCAAVELRTNVIRERAHAFYERLGYARKKSQHLYAKML